MRQLYIPNDEYFTRDLRPALSTFDDSRCLWISTPRGKGNYIYSYFLEEMIMSILIGGQSILGDLILYFLNTTYQKLGAQ